MSPDQFVGSLICLCSVAFIVIATGYEAIVITGRRDTKRRAARVVAEANTVIAQAADQPQTVDVDPWIGHTP